MEEKHYKVTAVPDNPTYIDAFGPTVIRTCGQGGRAI